jgi:hypothetical protein
VNRRRTLLQARDRLHALRKEFPEEIYSRLDDLLARTDLDELADRLLGDDKQPVLSQQKALHIPAHVLKETRRIHRLGLHEGPALDILDLGAGSGVFCWVACQFGHRAVALERPATVASIDLPAFIRFYGVSLSEQAVLPQTPLTNLGRFDLVTAFSAKFNHWRDEEKRRYWTADDYRFFLADLRINIVKPGGRAILQFNVTSEHPSERPLVEYYQSLAKLFEPITLADKGEDGILLDVSRPLDSLHELPSTGLAWSEAEAGRRAMKRLRKRTFQSGHARAR